MLMSLSTPSASSALVAASRWRSSLVGLALEIPRYEPPVKWMRLTASMVSGTACSVSPCISHLNPSRMPTTLVPANVARMVAAPMTLLMPGAGPPPHNSASRCESTIDTERIAHTEQWHQCCSQAQRSGRRDHRRPVRHSHVGVRLMVHSMGRRQWRTVVLGLVFALLLIATGVTPALAQSSPF